MRVTGLQAFIISFALRFRGIIVALFCLLVAYGSYGLGQASYDAFPEFAPPQVDVQTEAPGLSSEQVETLVTRPIEAAINGAPNLQRITSTSIQGLSDIKVYFDPATDLYRDRQFVSERLATVAGQLPFGVQSPKMTPLTSSAATVLVIGLTSPSQSLMRLRTIAKWTIRPSLLSVPGVAGAEIFGGEERATQILVDPERLARFGLAIDHVLAAARRASGVRGAGFVATPNPPVTLDTAGGPARTAAICCTAIPISLLSPVVVVQHFGVTLNAMTLGGLAIALGEVVDDAVIGIENITRRLRENRRRADPLPAARVVLDATYEVRSA